jgi:hypothetical protein
MEFGFHAKWPPWKWICILVLGTGSCRQNPISKQLELPKVAELQQMSFLGVVWLYRLGARSRS